MNRRDFAKGVLTVPASLIAVRLPTHKRAITEIDHKDARIGRVCLNHYVVHDKDEMHL